MLLVAIAIVLFISVVPVMVGARVVGARRNGFWIAFAALLIANLIVAFAFHLFRNLGFLSIFAAALGYMLVLDTTYLRGLGIALIQLVLTVLLVVALVMSSIGAMLHMRGMLRQLPIDIPSSVQSV